MTNTYTISVSEAFQKLNLGRSCSALRNKRRHACPVSSRCNFNTASSSSLIDHLFSVHRATKCSLQLDEEGIGHVEVQAPLNISRDEPRRSILVAECDGLHWLWTCQSQRRGDGETQVSVSIQALPSEDIDENTAFDQTATNCNQEADEDEDVFEGNSFPAFSKSFVQHAREGDNNVALTYFERSKSLPSFSAKALQQQSNSKKGGKQYHVKICASLTDQTIPSWEGELNSLDTEPKFQDQLVWRRECLILLHPTHQTAFRDISEEEDGEREVTIITEIRRHKTDCLSNNSAEKPLFPSSSSTASSASTISAASTPVAGKRTIARR